MVTTKQFVARVQRDFDKGKITKTQAIRKLNGKETSLDATAKRSKKDVRIIKSFKQKIRKVKKKRTGRKKRSFFCSY